MLKQTLKLSTIRLAAAAALVGAVGFSVIANTQNAEAASGKTVSTGSLTGSMALVDIVGHGWRGPRHCHWRLRRGRWVYFCHRHR
ncbi:MAG: hypothetical protein MPJ78_17300 [Hyphomicrobiaceae bacterium]|nr:hypothetical protein [Hyphomicrobiaceae bacterium]